MMALWWKIRFALLRFGARLPLVGGWCARRTQMAWYYIGGFKSIVDYSGVPESERVVFIQRSE